jgi:16S rRNA (cytosine967-C5)-methyltransferase
MSLAGSQQKVFLRLFTTLRPHIRRDQNFPARVGALFAAHRAFGSRDRKLYRELIYTTLRFLPWIEPLLESEPGRAVKSVAWLAADLPATRAFRGAVCGDWPPCPPTIAAKAAHLGANAETLLPDWFARHCPEAAQSPNLDVLHTRAPLWLRLQTSDAPIVLDEFTKLGWPARTSDVLPGALELLTEADVTKTTAWSNGLVEIQDLGSQLILGRAGIAPGERWLDACAGAGGKTLQLAALLGANGHVDAHDIRPEALRELDLRAARAHVTTITILPAPATGLYDGVLVDAPCSGTGTWRRSPHLKWTTSAGDVAKAADRQRTLLDEFSARVRPGGRLIYATCSLSRLENDEVAAAFLIAHPDFVPDGAPRTLLPATHNTDGFFVAPFRRR